MHRKKSLKTAKIDYCKPKKKKDFFYYQAPKPQKDKSRKQTNEAPRTPKHKNTVPLSKSRLVETSQRPDSDASAVACFYLPESPSLPITNKV